MIDQARSDDGPYSEVVRFPSAWAERSEGQIHCVALAAVLASHTSCRCTSSNEDVSATVLGTEEVATRPTPKLGLAMTVLLYSYSFCHSNALEANKKDNEVSLRTEHIIIVVQSPLPLPRKYDPRLTPEVA
jgi:hypothetical protein